MWIAKTATDLPVQQVRSPRHVHHSTAGMDVLGPKGVSHRLHPHVSLSRKPQPQSLPEARDHSLDLSLTVQAFSLQPCLVHSHSSPAWNTLLPVLCEAFSPGRETHPLNHPAPEPSLSPTQPPLPPAVINIKETKWPVQLPLTIAGI